MQRYNIDLKSYTTDDENGSWVKWEDVKIFISKINKESTYLDSVVLNSDNIDCNCEEMSCNHQLVWICPAHGYKKF